MVNRLRSQMIAVAVVAVAVLGVIGFLVFGSKTASQHAQQQQAVATDAHQAAAALGKLATDPQSLIASSSAGQVGANADSAVPKGSTIAPIEKSWRSDGVGGGVMTVVITSPGGATTTYLAIMVKESSGWKVEQTLTVPAISGSTPIPTASRS